MIQNALRLPRAMADRYGCFSDTGLDPSLSASPFRPVIALVLTLAPPRASFPPRRCVVLWQIRRVPSCGRSAHDHVVRSKLKGRERENPREEPDERRKLKSHRRAITRSARRRGRADGCPRTFAAMPASNPRRKFTQACVFAQPLYRSLQLGVKMSAGGANELRVSDRHTRAQK